MDERIQQALTALVLAIETAMTQSDDVRSAMGEVIRLGYDPRIIFFANAVDAPEDLPAELEITCDDQAFLRSLSIDPNG